jgi:hypothetical protein
LNGIMKFSLIRKARLKISSRKKKLNRRI